MIYYIFLQKIVLKLTDHHCSLTDDVIFVTTTEASHDLKRKVQVLISNKNSTFQAQFPV